MVVLAGLLAGCSYSGPTMVVSGERSHSTGRGSGPSAPPVTHTMGVNARPSPHQIAMALGTANRVTSARLGRYGKGRAVLVGVRAQGIRATVEAAWTTYVTTAVVMRDCQIAGSANCPNLFSEAAPNGSVLGAGRLTLSNARFPSSLPSVGKAVARRVVAAGLRATSVEVDNVGVAVVIVRAVATDPAEAVRSKADERSVAIPGIAGTLVEISDSHGNLVSINALCNLGQSGTGWTAPKYRALVPNQMGGIPQPSS